MCAAGSHWLPRLGVNRIPDARLSCGIAARRLLSTPMRIVPLVLLPSLVALPLAAQSALERRVDAYFAAAVAGHDFSGSVLIARGDSVLVRKGYGQANSELGVPARPDTRYMIASLTKTLTAAAVPAAAG